MTAPMYSNPNGQRPFSSAAALPASGTSPRWWDRTRPRSGSVSAVWSGRTCRRLPPRPPPACTRSSWAAVRRGPSSSSLPVRREEVSSLPSAARLLSPHAVGAAAAAPPRAPNGPGEHLRRRRHLREFYALGCQKNTTLSDK